MTRSNWIPWKEKMFVKSFLVGLTLLATATCVQNLHAQELQTQQGDSHEIFYFYDETQVPDMETQGAVKQAIEQGFRIRSIAANRFPNLAKRFQVRRLPSLLLLRKNKLAARHEGRFTFGRIRELLAKMRENRLERRDRIREMIVGRTNPPRRNDAPSSVAPIAPRYIQTSSNTVATEIASNQRAIPKPLDRNGKFAVAHVPNQAEAIAFDATVRIRVIDPSGTSHGTGTIIHSSGNDALVLTCGHIFRESRGRGRIEADIMFSSNMQTVNGRIISFDTNAHDIALLTIRTPAPVQAAKIARANNSEKLHAEVFTIGCDKGNLPTIRRSHFKRTAIYDGVEKYDVYGRPIDGRSGGGLFNRRGELIGVCNAAAVHTDEGIYSGLKTIYHELSRSHLSHLFNEAYWGGLAQNTKIQNAPTQNAIAKNTMEQLSRNPGALGTASNRNDGRFQALPPNPGLAFRNAGTRMVPVSQQQNNLLPPNSARQPAFGNQQSLPGSRSFDGSAVHNVRQQPRIPAFHLSSLTSTSR